MNGSDSLIAVLPRWNDERGIWWWKVIWGFDTAQVSSVDMILRTNRLVEKFLRLSDPYENASTKLKFDVLCRCDELQWEIGTDVYVI